VTFSLDASRQYLRIQRSSLYVQHGPHGSKPA
jgi:hypothetical protein